MKHFFICLLSFYFLGPAQAQRTVQVETEPERPLSCRTCVSLRLQGEGLGKELLKELRKKGYEIELIKNANLSEIAKCGERNDQLVDLSGSSRSSSPSAGITWTDGQQLNVYEASYLCHFDRRWLKKMVTEIPDCAEFVSGRAKYSNKRRFCH